MILKVEIFEGQDQPRPLCSEVGCRKTGKYVFRVSILGLKEVLVKILCADHVVRFLKPELHLTMEPEMVKLIQEQEAMALKRKGAISK